MAANVLGRLPDNLGQVAPHRAATRNRRVRRGLRAEKVLVRVKFTVVPLVADARGSRRELIFEALIVTPDTSQILSIAANSNITVGWSASHIRI
jgi:hypothetical protein